MNKKRSRLVAVLILACSVVFSTITTVAVAPGAGAHGSAQSLNLMMTFNVVQAEASWVAGISFTTRYGILALAGLAAFGIAGIGVSAPAGASPASDDSSTAAIHVRVMRYCKASAVPDRFLTEIDGLAPSV